MKKIIGIILILAGVGFALWGFQQYDDSHKGISIGKLEITAEKDNGSVHLISWGLAAVGLISGIGMLAAGDNK